MKSVLIAPVGEQMDSLFVGIREFPVEKIILLAAQQRKHDAEKIMKELEIFKISGNILMVNDETEAKIWENTFKIFSQIKSAEADKDIIVDIETGDKTIRLASLSAAFVNGMKAFTVSGDNIVMLPIMKFNYYKLIPDKKMEILRWLYEVKDRTSIEMLSRKTGMSLPLISYHINGNLKSEGLRDMGLIDTTEIKGRTSLEISLLGRMIVRGYVQPAEA